MLAVRYTSGTTCEINSNQPRETTVFYGKLYSIIQNEISLVYFSL